MSDGWKWRVGAFVLVLVTVVLAMAGVAQPWPLVAALLAVVLASMAVIVERT